MSIVKEQKQIDKILHNIALPPVFETLVLPKKRFVKDTF